PAIPTGQEISSTVPGLSRAPSTSSGARHYSPELLKAQFLRVRWWLRRDVIDLRQPRRRLRQYESRRRALIVTARTRKQIPSRSSPPLPCASVPASARARPVRAQEPHPPLRRRLDYVGGKTGKTPCTRGGPGQGSAALISRSAI